MKKEVPCLFELNYLFTPNEKLLAFPFWFNDSLIRQHDIVQIERKVFDNQDDSTFLMPRRIYTYSFDPKGMLTTLHVKTFYDIIVVGEIEFSFAQPKDGSDTYRLVTARMIAGNKEEQDEEYGSFTQSEWLRKTDKLTEFVNTNGDRRFYLADEKTWNPWVIDTLVEPNPSDIVIWGTTRRPVKEYHVSNIVKEDRVVNYSYHRKSNRLKSIHFDQFPFQQHRSFEYSKKGVCLGFVDSTFSQQNFLTRTTAKFTFDERLPIKVTYYTEHAGHQPKPNRWEEFRYTRKQ